MPPESLTRESTDTETDTSGGVNVMEGRDSDAVSEGSPEETTTDVADSSTATDLKSDFDPTQPTTDELETDTQEPTAVDPNQDISTTAEAIQGQTQALLDTLDSQEQESDLESEVQTREDRQQELIEGIEDTFNKLADKGETRSEFNEQLGLTSERTELADASQQLREEKKALRDQKERIRNQPGLSESQQQARIDEISRKSADKQADLALRKQAASGAIEAMETTIDRKIQNEFQPEKQRLELLKFQFKQNKDLLTDKEKRLYQKQVTEEEREFQKKKQERENEFSTKLSLVETAQENGAPSSVLSDIISADDTATAVEKAGEFASSASTTEFETFSQDDTTFKFNPETGEAEPIAGEGASTTTSTAQLPRANRNNNPGNLKFDNQQGAVGKDEDGFAKFDSLQDGLQALKSDIKAKAEGNTSTDLGPDSTLTEFAQEYAPAGDGNDPQQYASNVASALGTSTDTRIGSIADNRLNEFAGAVAQAEGFEFNQQQSQPKETFSKEVKAIAERVQNTENDFGLQNVSDERKDRVALAAAQMEPETPKEKKETILGKLRTVKNVKNHPALEAATGQIGRWIPTIRTFGDASAFTGLPFVEDEAGSVSEFSEKFDRIVNQETIENLDKLSGQMSDKDIELLKKAASDLDYSMTSEEVESELEKMENALLRTAEDMNITDEQAQFYFDMSADKFKEINNLVGGENKENNSTSTEEFDPSKLYNE